MRVAYISPHYAPYAGGVESHVEALAAGMAARGHQVEVITQTEPGAPQQEVRDGVRIVRFPPVLPPPAYAFSLQLSRYLLSRQSSFDLIHLHSYHALTSLNGAIINGPLIYTPHYHGTGLRPLGRLLHPFWRRLQRPVFARAAAVIAVSNTEAELLRRHFSAVAEKIEVIQHGVDVAALRAATPFGEEGRVILTAGRLKRYKGVDRLIAALAELDDDFRLVVAGEGPALPELRVQAEGLGLGDRVRFLGSIPRGELDRWLRTAAVYATLSSHEAFGLAPLEAATAGASIVASDVPAHREALAGLPTVSFVPPDAGSSEIASALLDQATKPRLMAQARTWDTVVEATEAVYARVLAPLPL